MFKRRTLPRTPDEVWTNPLFFIAFGLGSGTLPLAPGTFGTLMAIPIFLIFASLSPSNYFLFTLLFIFFSIWVCGKVSKQLHIHDHPGITLDEFAGFFVTMIGAPVNLMSIILGFLLFRLFDITKPWPIRLFDKKITGGLGIVLDDLLAGVFAMICMQIIFKYLNTTTIII